MSTSRLFSRLPIARTWERERPRTCQLARLLDSQSRNLPTYQPDRYATLGQIGTLAWPVLALSPRRLVRIWPLDPPPGLYFGGRLQMRSIGLPVRIPQITNPHPPLRAASPSRNFGCS